MARSIRWTFNFKSFAGVTCRVDIYDEGSYSPTTLTPATNPFYYEEDKSEDLLNVVRAKTGYIRVVETSYNELIDLYAISNRSHFVKFYYGSRLDFVGYMQCQAFENPWIAGSRVLEFPITSPLGVADGHLFEKNNPQYKTLASLLYEVMSGLNADYERVVYPDLLNGLAGKINTAIVCPFSKNFSQEMSSVWANLYDPLDYASFIKGLCNAFGLIAHDEGTSLVFSKFDHNGGYKYVLLSNLANLSVINTSSVSGNTTMSLDNYFSNRDDDGKHSRVMPLKKLDIQYQGDFIHETDIPFNRVRYNGESALNRNAAAWLKCLNGEIFGVADTNSINANGRLSSTGLIIACAGGTGGSFGTIEDDPGNAPYETILMQPSSSWSYNYDLVLVKYYQHAISGRAAWEIKMKWGSEIRFLRNEELDENLQFAYKIYVDNTLSETGSFRVDKSTGVGHINSSVEVDNRPVSLQISVGNNSGLEDSKIYSFDSIKMYTYKYGWSGADTRFSRYFNNETSKETLEGNQNSDISGSVDMLFSFYRKNANMIDNTIQSKLTDYAYMFRIQERLIIRFKLLSFPTYAESIYAAMFDFWNGSWRIISYSFSPSDDECTLVLHK